MQPSHWTNTATGLEFGSSLVSFQRFPIIGGAAPRTSHGALPVASGPTDFVLPLGEGEGFWIGALGSQPLTARARLLDRQWRTLTGELMNELTAYCSVPDDRGADMLLALPDVTAISLDIAGDRVVVEIARPADFTRLTGRPPPQPLGEGSVYRGWRLP